MKSPVKSVGVGFYKSMGTLIKSNMRTLIKSNMRTGRKWKFFKGVHVNTRFGVLLCTYLIDGPIGAEK